VTGAGFRGFPSAAIDFYDGLEADNSRSYWAEHKTTYDECVRGPMLALLALLAPEFGEGTVFRPHRDVRFSKDKSPYKTHQGGFIEVEDGVGFYVQISAAGLLVAAGWHPKGQQVLRYREAVDGAPGAELDRVVGQLETAGYTIGGERLKTRPRGLAPGHPREDLLRHKSLTAERGWDCPVWLETPETADRVAADWRTVSPLVDWLAAHVGPGES
jgi:uncharacterized protein (TIGR02453 family)